MSNPNVLHGEVAFGEPLLDSGLAVEGFEQWHARELYGVPSKLMTLASRTNIVVRPSRVMHPNVVVELNQANYAEYIGELFYLDELGLKTPGISQAKEPVPYTHDDRVIVYDIANKIDGYSLAGELSLVPREVALEAYSAELIYFRDALCSESRLRLSDLALRQLKYGTVGEEVEPQLYLVDIDRFTWNPSKSPQFTVKNAINAAHDMEALEVAYEEELPEQRILSALLIEDSLRLAEQAGAKMCDDQQEQLRGYLGDYANNYTSTKSFPLIAKYAGVA